MKRGFAVIKDAGWISERFGSGTISKMALIQKTRDDGSFPERLVLPRVMDVWTGPQNESR